MTPNLNRVPPFFHNYIKLVPDVDLIKALHEQENTFSALLDNIPEDKWDYCYEQNKWTIREMILHCIDTERIFAYRALCIARKDTSPLQSFDENAYALHSKANNRSIESLKQEFNYIRKSTTLLFEGLDEEQMETEGKIGEKLIYVGALGFIIVGHIMHHEQILKERYLK